MRFYVKHKETTRCLKISEEIIDLLINEGHVIDEINPEFVFSIGGDGTFLKTVHSYLNANPIFIGINEGNLGFLCEFNYGDFNYILDLINNFDESNLFYYPLLSFTINDEIFYALNEIRIESINGASIRFDININDDYLEKLNGDGVVISTSLGSSGISRGLGGSLIDHRLEVMQLIEKTPIINRCYNAINSPIILDENNYIVLDRFSFPNFNIYYDNLVYEVRNFNKDIKISLTNKKIKVLKSTYLTYVNKLNDAFIN